MAEDDLASAGDQPRAAMQALEVQAPEPQPSEVAPQPGMSATQKTAIITALLTGLFGSMQSMRGAGEQETAKRFERAKASRGQTYDTLAHNQNILSGAVTRLSKRNLALKKRILKLERALRRIEEGVDDESPLLIFGREQPTKIIKIQPLPILEGPVEHDD